MIKINIKKTRLDSICTKYSKHIIEKIKPLDSNDVFEYYKSQFPNIISAHPEDFDYFHEGFTAKFKFESDDFKLFYEHMKSEYKRLFGNVIEPKTTLGTWLASELNIKVCPYCNRQYTFTVSNLENNKGVRPQFDHFCPKSEFPYFALSFYNLIPSCPTCNHAKGEDAIDINPYVEGFGANCKFTIDKLEKCILNGNRDLWSVNLPSNGIHISHVSAFALNDLYNQHKDYVEEIVTKAQSYDDGYYKSLIDSFSGLGLSERGMNVLIFGNYTSVDDFDKRPLSKLTADILEQLEIKL
ncbi:MAG: hypothetical protein RR313_05645 [Anaerovoracaceae bacterium]